MRVLIQKLKNTGKAVEKTSFSEAIDMIILWIESYIELNAV
jgi:hypothetical protein